MSFLLLNQLDRICKDIDVPGLSRTLSAMSFILSFTCFYIRILSF